MRLRIPSEVRQRTTRCPYDFKCLDDGKSGICPANGPIPDDGLFVEAPPHKTCGYRMSFGDAYICNCPTRKEIFTRYGY